MDFRQNKHKVDLEAQESRAATQNREGGQQNS